MRSNRPPPPLDLSSERQCIDLTTETPSPSPDSQTAPSGLGRKRKFIVQDMDDDPPSPYGGRSDDSYIDLTDSKQSVTRLPKSKLSHHERKRMRKCDQVQDLKDRLFQHNLQCMVEVQSDYGPDILLPSTPLGPPTPHGAVFTTPPSKAASLSSTPQALRSQKPHNSSSGTGKTTFFTLPGELRNRIYREALVENEEEYIEISAANWNTHQPGLLQTCKQIRKKALPIFYAENSISVNVHNWSPAVKDRMHKLLSAHKIKPTAIPCHHFTGGPNWTNLEALLKAVYEKKIPGISDCVGKPRDLQRKTVGVCFLLVRKARAHGAPWEMLEDVLGAQQSLLAYVDSRWELEDWDLY